MLPFWSRVLVTVHAVYIHLGRCAVLSVNCYDLMPYGKILCVDFHAIREQPTGCFRPRFGLMAARSVGHMDVGWCLARQVQRWESTLSMWVNNHLKVKHLMMKAVPTERPILPDNLSPACPLLPLSLHRRWVSCLTQLLPLSSSTFIEQRRNKTAMEITAHFFSYKMGFLVLSCFLY